MEGCLKIRAFLNWMVYPADYLMAERFPDSGLFPGL